MKKIFLLSLSLCGVATAFAQQYKIVIHYDANGNRIIRERVAQTADRPAEDNPAEPDTLEFASKTMVLSQKLSAEATAEILIFPNPTAGNFTVELGSLTLLSQSCTIMVTDALGRQIIHRRLSERRTSFDLSREADGLYMCTVISGDLKKTVRLVKKTR